MLWLTNIRMRTCVSTHKNQNENMRFNSGKIHNSFINIFVIDVTAYVFSLMTLQQ
jgi:hypothetical protein